MSTNASDAAVWNDWCAELLHEAYGIAGHIGSLPGEVDRNFKVDVAGHPAFVLKVVHPDADASLVDMQIRAMQWVRAREQQLPIPEVARARDGSAVVHRRGPNGALRACWMLTHLPGRPYARIRPHPPALFVAIGHTLARLHRSLAEFDHDHLDRSLKWDLRRSTWIRPHLTSRPEDHRHAWLLDILDRFEQTAAPVLATLPGQAIHNDLNDYNVLVSMQHEAFNISGVIDFGDMLRGPAVCDVAIAAAYAVLGHTRPFDALSALVHGYCTVRALSDVELSLLYPLLLTRLAVSVTNAAIEAEQRPNDPYVTISQKPAWAFLDAFGRTHPDWVLARLRTAVGRPAVPHGPQILRQIAAGRGDYAPVIQADLNRAPTVDFTPEGQQAPQDPFHMVMPTHPGVDVQLGRYGEPRLIYNAPAFALGPHPTSDHRTVHLGVDVFAPAGTPICTPSQAVVRTVDYRHAAGDYGGVVVLEHRTPQQQPFFTLYGHLARSVAARLKPGQTIAEGEAFAELGAEEDNGGWPPHLHFQLGLLAWGPDCDWPGVADPDDLETAEALFPNPAALLNLDDAQVATPIVSPAELAERRVAHFGPNLSTSYRTPIVAVRGWRHYLFDSMARTYLDAYNNVPHVGHAHPRLTAVVADQMRLINTNTRYLHPARTAYAEALTARMPEGLDTCFLLNSASEANELALRLARAHTGSKQVITVDAGYHGHTISAVDISAYKFNGPGGEGPPDWVEVVPVADPYRGPHRGQGRATGRAYAAYIDAAIDRIQSRGDSLGAFICEPFPSVGGQIVPPDHYLAAVYERVRRAGGVCIADEVQTGLGRLGRYFWGFEQQGAHPDVVVLGKPLGNGYPLAAVITTRDIAHSFANGMEFFSTFGGSTLACAVGHELLRIIDDEQLPENAAATGDYLLAELRRLADRHPLIGDVRGLGLFIGVDLVIDRESRTPASAAARYVVERLRAHRILIGRDGPEANVLKIRPPMTFGRDDADLLLSTLDAVLSEALLPRS